MADENVEMLYITRYALSSGIQCVKGRSEPDGHAFYQDDRPNVVFPHQYASKSEWFRDYPSALAAAEAQRAKKIASLKKQIAKLEALTFSDPSAE